MVRRCLALLVLLVLACYSSWPALATPARAAATPSWVTWNAGTRTATVTVIAAYNQVGGGFNFDGYNNGGLTITVPHGARVTVNFTNKASFPHSVVITPYAKRALPAGFPTAFPGASTPNPTQGVAGNTKPQTFSFTAAKDGAYALVCGVP